MQPNRTSSLDVLLTLQAFTIETASTFTTRRGLRNRQHVTSEQTYMLLVGISRAAIAACTRNIGRPRLTTALVALQLRHFDQGDCKSFFSQWHSKVLDPRIADNLHKVVCTCCKVYQAFTKWLENQNCVVVCSWSSGCSCTLLSTQYS